LTKSRLRRKTRSQQKEQRLKRYSERLEKLVEKRTNDLGKDEEKLKSIFAASPDAITVTDLNGRIVDCNQATLAICGSSSKQELIGKNSIVFIAKKDRKKAMENLEKTLVQGSARFEYTFLKKDGSEYPAELSVSVVRDVSGNPTFFVGIIKDITERKKAEKVIRESQQKFERLFVSNPEAAIYTDTKWRILDINPRFIELFGYSLAEVKGKSPFEVIVPKDKLKESKTLGEKSREGYTYHETIRKKKDGSQVHVSISAAPITVDSQPIGYVTLYKDITERKRTEEALMESEKRYRSVVDNIGIGVAVISPHMEILSLNNQMKKWFQHIDVSRKPICYRSFNNPPGKKPCSYCPTVKTLRNGQIHDATTKTPSDDKIINYRIVASPIKDKDGKVLAAIEMVDDVTERKRLEEQLKRYSEHLEESVEERTGKLKENEEHFRSVVNYASEAVITMNSHGTIIFWNKAAEDIFGYSAKEAIGKSIMLIMPEGLKKNHLKTTREMISAGKLGAVMKTAEFVVRKKDGRKFPIEHSFSIWKTNQGTFFTCIVRDITEQRKMEERLSALNSYSGKLNAAKNLQQICKLTLDAMKQILGFEYADFMLMEKGNLNVVCQYGYRKPLPLKLPIDGSKRGITVKSAVLCKPILVLDVRKNKNYIATIPGIKSELAVPIITNEEVRGVLNVESTELNAFNQKDVALVQILASHAATAMSNLSNTEEIEKRNKQQASLMKSSAEMIHSTELRQRLQAILDAIKGLGWRRVVLSVRNQSLDIAKPEDIVTAGLTNQEKEFLWTNRQPGQVWQERFGQSFGRFRIGEFYYLPWSDPWVRQKFTAGTVESHLKPEEMVDWNPDDLLYAPLRLADGRIVGVVSIDDPLDGRRPTKESLAPLELFLHQAAVAIENAKLLQQLKEYSEHLEDKVEERTRELKEVQKQLLKSERLAAIGELAGMVGHDLRNPLTGITGATYYLKTKYESKMDDKGKEMLRIIGKDIDYSNKIINDLLEYSRDIKLDLTETDPKQIFIEALSFVQIPKDIQIINKIQSRPRINVDIERMRRVFINIIKNAFDAMPNGGKLTITTKKVKDNVVFDFSDTGVGMSKETINKLWTPLFTTKARGMGFGLPICKRILEAHGGKISVESKIGEGTTFKVTIPIRQKPIDGGESVWVKEPESLLLTTTKA
jgi:PAS domain S-box-containing protein